ncbi:FGGY-family carbohydrate kinase [Komagataeibacter sp. FNDCR2]|uniref:FGGY-family carbohydrate kinase n=1 Tax=Komagataeibacter sp. FNDCR2 TaxID=2878682 RepID=UPI001E50E8A8|nr:FGGY-family carbohydrate kinase [Komagataeibacter sp. FNDCR2]MCE2576590.1 carbohydrate kinase [Komagataeibacter sp. FNDCR2]
MRRDFIIGIDCGSTATKAVIFSPTGQIVGTGRRRLARHMDRPHYVERDMGEAWLGVAQTIRMALADAGLSGQAIAAVGITAHGDGLFMLDRMGNPLGRGIMSLDSRATALHESWRQRGVLDQLVPVAGQRPYVYSASTLLAWIRDHEPERYHAIGSILFAKDWIRLCLTGEVATDMTEASTAFTDLHTQQYSREILDILGLGAIHACLPPMLESCTRAGGVTPAAAAATGLLAGTPVAAGLHDVTAAAVGMGHTCPGDMSLTAGTFSINEVFRDHPVTGDGWSCRAGYRRGLWNCMAISPASSSNLEWMAKLLLPHDGEATGLLMREVEARLATAREARTVPLFHPFLFGSPYAAPASASFFGVQSWHDRTDLFQAMVEGMVFNHRMHVTALRQTGAVARLGVSGGGSGQPAIAQLFADVLDMPVDISGVREAGALGAALTAAVAVGLYPDLEHAVDGLDVSCTTYRPDAARVAVYDSLYHRYVALTRAMRPFWQSLYDMTPQPTDQPPQPAIHPAIPLHLSGATVMGRMPS